MNTNLRILLMEDNKYHSLLIKRELTESYPQAVLSVFQSAAFAFDELQRNNYRVAIIDFNPAWSEGVDFIRKLHQEKPSLKIVVLALNDTNQLSQNVLEAGANRFIIKNDTFHRLLPDIIDKLLNPPSKKIKLLSHGLKLLPEETSTIIDLTVGTLAHEINNPLMTILGETELLLNNGYRLAPEIDRKLRIIEKSAQRIRKALTKLSNISEPTLKETPTGVFIELDKP